MAKWKLLKNYCNQHSPLIEGEVYDGSDYPWVNGFSIEYEVGRNSNFWQKVEDEFVLPEKWCIKLTKENIDDLNNWRTDKGCLNDNHLGMYQHTPMAGRNGYNCYNRDEDYTEITYDQFIKYVYEPWKKKREDAIEEVKENLSKCSDDLIEELVKPWPYIKDMGVMVANQTIPVSKPYPKWMMVWDDAMINGLKTKRYVLCEDNGMYVAYLEMNKTDKERVRHWPYAEDIQEPVVYKCPYNKEVRCPMKDCCNGCENWKPEVF